MIRTSNVGRRSLRVHARSKGEATRLARALNVGAQLRVIGPKAEGVTGGSLLLVFPDAPTRNAARDLARTAPNVTTAPAGSGAVPALRDDAAAKTRDEGGTMATRSTTGKRPKRSAAPTKKAATKKAAAKRKAAAPTGAAPRRGRPPGGGVGELVKTLLRASASEAKILASVKRCYPDSALLTRPAQHLAWYRHRVRAEDAG